VLKPSKTKDPIFAINKYVFSLQDSGILSTAHNFSHMDPPTEATHKFELFESSGLVAAYWLQAWQ